MFSKQEVLILIDNLYAICKRYKIHSDMAGDGIDSEVKIYNKYGNVTFRFCSWFDTDKLLSDILELLNQIDDYRNDKIKYKKKNRVYLKSDMSNINIIIQS